jgi:alpha-D-ribose 1-methylphosphonate 5-triphosphate synthase subunit PhnG
MWCSLLAQCNEQDLVQLIESMLSTAASEIQVHVVMPVRTGTAQLPVREPVANEQFFIGDALVSTAEVSVNGVLGWAMRLGSHTDATMAAAIADAILCDASSPLRNPILEFLADADQVIASNENEDWAKLQSTIVEFEELD